MTNNTNAPTEWVTVPRVATEQKSFSDWFRDNLYDENIGVVENAIKRSSAKAAWVARSWLSDSPECEDGGAACIDCMCSGQCRGAAPPAPEAGWRPIETGPVNVEVLALYKGRRHVIAMQRSADDSPSGWCHHEAFGNDGPFRGLTHWAPLLPAPTAGTNTTEGA